MNGLQQTLEKALDQFPTIKQVITLEKLLELVKKNPHEHFIYYLSKSSPKVSKVQEMLDALKEKPNDGVALLVLGLLIETYCIMKHLDGFLETIKDEPKLGKYISHLTEPNSFWQGYSEIEVASNLKQIFGDIELEPKLANGKSVDVKFQLGSEDVFVEVTAPKRCKN